MSATLLELALKKQRLQFKSDMLRQQWRSHARGLAPAFGAADRVLAGYVWLRRHPEVVVGVGVAVAVAKPRAVWRWFKRGVVAWQFWREGQQWLAATQPHRRT
jgi:nitric oxide reductase large subunit